MSDDLERLAEDVVSACRARGIRIATAESCTGGMVAAALTSVAGASDVFESGFVTYSNSAKVSALGVDEGMLSRFGAVSEEVARAMAEGACSVAGVDAAVAVTGIAGPGGGSVDKPVGTTWIASATSAERFVFAGDRFLVRLRAARAALCALRREAAKP